MIQKNVDLRIQVLWKDNHFIKNEWGTVNYIVGPNGTGKSMLAEQLKSLFNSNGFRSRYLNAERLIGLERRNTGYFGGGSLVQGFDIGRLNSYKSNAESSGLSSSALVMLRERLDIRIKIEALLSDIFGKSIRLLEEGGFLKVKMQNLNGGAEYNLVEHECHGLKELITLLTLLNDPDKNCLFLDEPELHLHPQFQSFLLEEIRKIAGNPLEDASKKMFFIITHSPYFLDFKSLDDLKNVIVCHLSKVPTFIQNINADDEPILRKFLPRFNTHHKQFFFSPNPVFVEGYTDQQIIATIFEKLGINIGASGSSIIDVGGKDELAVFFKLCQSLGISIRIIADLDSLFRGRLRQTISNDQRAQSYIQDSGIGPNLANEIGDLETHLSSIAAYILQNNFNDVEVNHLKNMLTNFGQNEEHKKRYSMLLGILEKEQPIRGVLNAENIGNLNFIVGRINQIINAFKACNVFILRKGEIENYYTQSTIDYLNVTGKDSMFHAEFNYLIGLTDSNAITQNYPHLLLIIREAVPNIKIEIRKHLKFEVIEWIQRVQRAIAKSEVTSQDQLIGNAKINYQLYNQILEVQNLTINEDLSFTCQIKVVDSLIDEEVNFEFTEHTLAHNFEF